MVADDLPDNVSSGARKNLEGFADILRARHVCDVSNLEAPGGFVRGFIRCRKKINAVSRIWIGPRTEIGSRGSAGVSLMRERGWVTDMGCGGFSGRCVERREAVPFAGVKGT